MNDGKDLKSQHSEGPRQKDHKFPQSLGLKVRPCFKKLKPGCCDGPVSKGAAKPNNLSSIPRTLIHGGR